MASSPHHTNHSHIHLVSCIVMGLYLSACFLPCIDSGPAVPVSSDLDFHVFDRGCHFGMEILLFGWSGGNNGVPWSANAFLALGLLCLWSRRLRVAVALGIV